MDAPRTLCELLEKSVESYKNPKMLNSKVRGTWESLSSDQVYLSVKHVALGLHSLGIVPGDRVALYADSSSYWTIADLGIIQAGAADVPIYVTQALPDIEFILKNSEAICIFVGSKKLYERARGAIEKTKCKLVIGFPREDFGSGVIEWSDLIAEGRNEEEVAPDKFEEFRGAAKEDDLATIIYTSGTTGEPKGVMLSHKNLVSNAVDCARIFTFNGIDDVALSYLPPSHVFERMILYHYINVGIQVYYAESVDALPKNMLEVRPHIMTTVPRMLEKAFEKAQTVVENMQAYKKALFKWAVNLAREFDSEKKLPLGYRVKQRIASFLVYKNLRAAFGGRIRFIISGGAPLDPELARIFCAAGLPVLQGYGLTETSPVISVNRVARNRIGSVGPLIPNVSVKIAGDGEILVDGPNVMRGYYKNPGETAASFEGSWFKTGDIGHLDKDGFLFVTDRKKDLLKTSGGKFIAPQEIETLLARSLYVEKAIVIGDRRKFASALIFPNWDALTGFTEKNEISYSSRSDLLANGKIKTLFSGIVEDANSHLSQWETIKKFAVVEGELSVEADYLTPTLKMKRRNVEGRYRDLIESFYQEEQKR